MATGMYALKLYASHLTLATYGVVAFALALMFYLPYFDGGFRVLLNRSILVTKNEDDRDRMIRFGQSLYILLGLLFVFLAVLLMGCYSMTQSARNSGLPLSFFLTLGAVSATTFISTAQTELLYGLHQQGKMYIVQATGSWVLVSVMTLGFSRGWGVWAFPASAASAFVVVYPFSIRLIKHSVPRFKWFDLWYDREFWKLFSSLKGEAWSCCRMQLSGAAITTADVFIVGALLPDETFAAYYILCRFVWIVKSVLQIGGEVGWPFFARLEDRKLSAELIWLRLHSWLYGAAVGSLAVTLIPFCAWWMGKEWVVGSFLLWLVALRFLVTGIASGVIYLYYGMGNFKVISGCFQREMIISVLLSLLGAYLFGLNGVAGAFLIGAIAGTGWPVFRIYARDLSVNVFPILAQVWLRALLGMAISYSVGSLLFRWAHAGIFTPFIGAAGVLACLMVMGGISIVRGGWAGGGFSSKTLRSLASKI